MRKLHIDIETYSSEDLKKTGVYRYAEALDFEILILAYAIDDSPIKIVDLAQGEPIPGEFILAFNSPQFIKYAHNAAFERVCLTVYGFDNNPKNWICTSVWAAYCGHPRSLEKAGESIGIGSSSKSGTGKELIKYFSVPCKPTKVNGGRRRNLPRHDLEKWQAFKDYCAQDVEAERAIARKLCHTPLPLNELANYALDQLINDRGVGISIKLARNAQRTYDLFKEGVKEQIKQLTKLNNPNSLPQLKAWILEQTGVQVTSIAKDTLPDLLAKIGEGVVSEVLELRSLLAKSSISKYTAMLDSVCEDGRGRGYLQFYGANTGRWAGRIVQLQNLPQNHLPDLEDDRTRVRDYEPEELIEYYENLPSVLSQLIRTAIIPKACCTFCVADYSAIEARVIAWISGEQWRLEVFRTHGKIYEASASKMFNVPMALVTKDSEYRSRGKVAELALGYQGAAGALAQMGGEKMGLSESEMKEIVKVWRGANKEIVDLWKDVEGAAKACVKKEASVIKRGLLFQYRRGALSIRLPSGRKLFYQKIRFSTNKFGSESLKYQGFEAGRLVWVDTYGGKLVENIVQAIARDLLADCMLKIEDQVEGSIVMHVHDEVIVEVPSARGAKTLKQIEKLMSIPPKWAKGLPLAADGYTTNFYKKD